MIANEARAPKASSWSAKKLLSQSAPLPYELGMCYVKVSKYLMAIFSLVLRRNFLIRCAILVELMLAYLRANTIYELGRHKFNIYEINHYIWKAGVIANL